MAGIAVEITDQLRQTLDFALAAVKSTVSLLSLTSIFIIIKD